MTRAGEMPAWMARAWAEFGQREAAGAASNPRIRQLYRDARHPEVQHDEVAWCAAFVGACLERTGIASTRSLLARSYMSWGDALDAPAPFAVAVFKRGADPRLGHVGFIVGMTDANIYLLGGNQSDAVMVAAFPRSELLAVRWPAAAQQVELAPADLFEQALAHVLDMEGGWTDDPYDPGGPTNYGITLETYARHLDIELTVETMPRLKSALRRIPQDVVRAIYDTHYWQPSAAAGMPPPVALMHFDASVNHGVAGAARMLQQIAGVERDGEVGPDTLRAVNSIDPIRLVEAYADARRERYRALSHFWRFGRGWLARVDKTLAASIRLATVTAPSRSTNTPVITQETPMTTFPSSTQPLPGTPKWWGHSMTIWGTIVTGLATVLPVIGPIIGLDITADLVREFGDQLTRALQAIGGLIGILMTILGRVRATQPLTLHG